MKKFFLFACCALKSVTPAYAQADQGHVYAGIVSGVASTSPHYDESVGTGMERNPAMTGLTGGAVAGVDFRINGITVGAEADIALLRNRAKNDPQGANWYTAFDVKQNSHVRVRVGINAGHDTKIFVAGGAGFLKMTTDDTDPNWGAVTNSYTGWSAGGGIEHRIGRKLWFRAEYLHDDYGPQTGTIDFQTAASYGIRTNPDTNTFRLGVVYRF